MDGDYRKLSFRLDADVARAIEQLAKRNCGSVGAELRRAVQAHLARNDDEPLCQAARVTTSADAGDGRVPAYP
jgi:predicted transcriptional regulator